MSNIREDDNEDRMQKEVMPKYYDNVHYHMLGLF